MLWNKIKKLRESLRNISFQRKIYLFAGIVLGIYSIFFIIGCIVAGESIIPLLPTFLLSVIAFFMFHHERKYEGVKNGIVR